MNDLKTIEYPLFSIFSNPVFGELRTVELEGEPWFVASDVCRVLDIQNATQTVFRLDEDERSMLNIGRQGEAHIVNETGLYSLVLGSRKPEAKAFKRWITHDVIPSIRKHGAYMTPDTIEKALLNPDTIIQLATQLKDEQEKRKAAESKIEADRPKVLFADSVAGSRTSILIRDLAKLIAQNGYNIGEKRLFQWLRENGYLISKSGRDYNRPTQKSMELGVMEVKETSISHTNSTQTAITPLITGKGQRYFITKILDRS